jgi:hypothetical protein
MISKAPTATGALMCRRWTSGTQFADHREQFIEDTVEIDRGRPVQQIQALERAVVVVKMRDETASNFRCLIWSWSNLTSGKAWQFRLKGFQRSGRTRF